MKSSSVPPERSHRVIIVGAGPVGLVAAGCLARLGVRALVIDQNAGVAEGSRAVCLSRRTLEILDSFGAAEPFVRKGLGWTHGSAYAGADLIHRLAMPHGPDDKHWPMTNLQQYYMEEFLLAHCIASGVEVRRNTTLLDVRQNDDAVVLTVNCAGGEEMLCSDYVIAADGARSQARKSLGLALEGVSYTGRYLIADIRLASAAPVERRVWFDPPSNPGATVIMHKQPDDVWRLDYQLQNAADEHCELQADRVRERIQSHLDFIGERRPWELLWHSIYRAHSLALQCYRHGRVLFAGDAAHLVPIFGVRGLNSGVADAHNLAWKLVHVLRRLATGRLLDSYSVERRAATLEIFRQSGKSTRFMTPHTPGEALLRDAVLALAVEHEFVRPLIDPRQSVPYEYLSSPLNSFAEQGRELAGGVRIGAPLRNMRVQGPEPGQFLLDWLGDDFTVLVFAAGALSLTDAAALAEISSQPSGPQVLVVSSAAAPPVGLVRHARMHYLQDAHDGARRLYGASQGAVYLVRPDGHVCARWRCLLPDELVRAWRRAVGSGTLHSSVSLDAGEKAEETPLESAYRELVAGLDAQESSRRADYLARIVLLLLDRLECAQPAVDAIVAARLSVLTQHDTAVPADSRSARTAPSAN